MAGLERDPLVQRFPELDESKLGGRSLLTRNKTEKRKACAPREGVARPPTLGRNAGKAASRGSMETGCQGHTLGTRDPLCWGPLSNPGTFSHSPACPVSGHSPFLLERRPRARDRRRHFSLFPGCARTAHNPNKPRAFASSASLPWTLKHMRLRPTSLSTAPAPGCPAHIVAVRAQAQSLAVDAPANGVRARSAEREGVGPARGAAPPYVGM